jgi:hypothetical protein
MLERQLRDELAVAPRSLAKRRAATASRVVTATLKSRPSPKQQA